MDVLVTNPVSNPEVDGPSDCWLRMPQTYSILHLGLQMLEDPSTDGKDWAMAKPGEKVEVSEAANVQERRLFHGFR